MLAFDVVLLWMFAFDVVLLRKSSVQEKHNLRGAVSRCAVNVHAHAVESLLRVLKFCITAYGEKSQ